MTGFGLSGKVWLREKDERTEGKVLSTLEKNLNDICKNLNNIFKQIGKLNGLY